MAFSLYFLTYILYPCVGACGIPDILSGDLPVPDDHASHQQPHGVFHRHGRRGCRSARLHHRCPLEDQASHVQ